MATHSSILAWRIPWTEETGRLESMGLQRVKQLKRLSKHTCMFQLSEDPFPTPIVQTDMASAGCYAKQHSE